MVFAENWLPTLPAHLSHLPALLRSQAPAYSCVISGAPAGLCVLSHIACSQLNSRVTLCPHKPPQAPPLLRPTCGSLFCPRKSPRLPPLPARPCLAPTLGPPPPLGGCSLSHQGLPCVRLSQTPSWPHTSIARGPSRKLSHLVCVGYRLSPKPARTLSPWGHGLRSFTRIEPGIVWARRNGRSILSLSQPLRAES